MPLGKAGGMEAIHKVGTPLGTSFGLDGPLKIIQESSGHSRSTITQDSYLAATPQMDRERRTGWRISSWVRPEHPFDDFG